MKVNKIVLKNFRNYMDITINFTDSINIFIGENAQGKTNILEAIYYGGIGHSHRTNVDSELIRWEQDHASISIFYSRLSIDNNLLFKLHTTKNKEIIANSHPLKPKKGVVGIT